MSERPVLGFAAAHANAKPHTSATQHIELGDLLGQQHSLAQRRDDDRGHELDTPSDGGDIGEQHQRFMRIGALWADDLIGDAQVRESQVLGDQRKLCDRLDVIV